MPVVDALSSTASTLSLIKPQHPALHVIHADPPVYVIPNFLSSSECADLMQAANACKEIPYEDEVKLRWDRLHLLVPLIVISSTGLVVAGHDPSEAFGASLGVAVCLVTAASALFSFLVEKGALRCFTGTKWDIDAVNHPFAARAASLFGVSTARLEPVTLTRYNAGEYQRQHLDARPLGDTSGVSEFASSGGQRLAQVIVYLQAPAAGGETTFHGPAFGGRLAVQPEKGTALVFPTACMRDGTPDERYVHCGEPVSGPRAKWIVGSWLMQGERSPA